MSDARTPVTVVTGFLGAGKTTLVNRWLGEQPRGDIAVVVNEHGRIGIDAELLAARARVLVEITGGCVCCATQAELVRALDELAGSPARRIVVETSGAASPAGVVRAIASGGRSDAFELDGVITVVDASRVDALAEHDLAIEQLGYADVVVLSHADTVPAEALAQADGVVASRNGAALVAHASRGALVDDASLEALLDRRRVDFVPGHVVAAPARHDYVSVSASFEGDVDGERFSDFVERDLGALEGRLFRTKGILAVRGVAERMIVQGVADRIEVTFGEPWGSASRTSRLVVVGYGLDEHALVQGFRACGADVEGSWTHERDGSLPT